MALGDRAPGLEIHRHNQGGQPRLIVGGVEDLIFSVIARRSHREQEKDHHQIPKAIIESMLSLTMTKQHISPP